MRRLQLTVAALGLVPFGCVSQDAGYAEVRQLTAARLDKDVRWHAREGSDRTDERTREALARPLRVDSAVQLALWNNQQLQADFEALGVARGRWQQALRLPNPTVDAALRFEPGQSRHPNIELDALIDVTALAFVPLRSGVASAALVAARTGVVGRALDVAFEARTAFYDFVAANRELELRRSILAALRASFALAQKLHDAGNITLLNFANERALYEESRVAYTQAEATLATRREALNATLGLWGPRAAAWRAARELPEPPSEPAELGGLERAALEKSLDLALHQQRYRAAAKRANLQRAAGWTPALRAGVSAERDSGAQADWAIGPALEIELPLLYQGQGETNVALAELRRERRLYADTALRVRAAARAAAARLEAARASAAYYRDVLLPLREQIVRESELQFNAMSVSAFQLLQAKREQIETASAHVEALRAYSTARAEVDQLLAGRLPRRAGATSPDPAEPELPQSAPAH